MDKCEEKSSRSMQPIASWGLDQSIFTVARNPESRLKNGHVTHLTVKIYPVGTQTMAVLSLSFREGNPGEEVIADATIHFFHRHDGESAWTESTHRLAI